MPPTPLKPTPPAKRALDIVLSSVGLLASSPLWAAIAVAIKLEDGGPVFYGQERVGKGGEPFRSWKFRSMRPGEDPVGNGDVPECQAGRDDPRITRVGRLLRATAMDELPQLWSIFRGDMSFVGPRAMLPEEETLREGRVTRLADVDGFAERHSVLPGLTGVAQVYAARDLPPREKFRYDRLYVRSRSFWLDVRLILVSFWISFRGAWPEVGRSAGRPDRPEAVPADGEVRSKAGAGLDAEPELPEGSYSGGD